MRNLQGREISLVQKASHWVAHSKASTPFVARCTRTEIAGLDNAGITALRAAFIAGFNVGRHYPLNLPDPQSNRSKKARGK